MARLTILTLLLLSLNCSGCRRLQGVCPSGVIEGSLAIHNGEVTTFNNLAWEEDWGPIEDVPLNKCRTVRGDLWITDGMRELRKLNAIEEVAGVITFLDVTGDQGALRDIFPALRTASGLRGAQAVGRFDVMPGFGSLVSIGFIQDDGFGAAGFEGFERLENADSVKLNAAGTLPAFSSLARVTRLELHGGGAHLELASLEAAGTIYLAQLLSARVSFPSLSTVDDFQLFNSIGVVGLELPLVTRLTRMHLGGVMRLTQISLPLLSSVEGDLAVLGTGVADLRGLPLVGTVGGDLFITDNYQLGEQAVVGFLAHVQVGRGTYVCRNQGMPNGTRCEP